MLSLVTGMHEKGLAIYLVVPAYNPTDRLPSLLERLIPTFNDAVVVVNDGSITADADSIFNRVTALGCTVLSHPVNRGKGAALKTAFAWCAQHGGDTLVGVVTADADGQHLAADIVAVRDALAANPDKLILGCRDFSYDGVPARSKAGNRSMSLAMRVFFGLDISDTQTGLRGIPARLMRELVDVRGNAYEFETNMLVEARHAGVAIAEVPITTVYDDGNAGSHFNPIRDSLRVAGVFARYGLSSCASAIVDLAAFSALNALFAVLGAGLFSIVAATYSARVVSAVVNFLVNHRLVFKRGEGKKAAMRYAALCVACVSVSAAAVTAIQTLLPMAPAVAIKVVVDCALFFINYRIQQAWVFSGGRHDAAHRA